MNRWAIFFRADGAGGDSFERGEDFGNVRAVARREFSTRGLGQFFTKRNRFAGGVFSLRRVMERAELAGGGIALHLPVPIVILERMQQCLQLATLLQRELVNRSLDFSNRAHAGKLSVLQFGFNAAKPDLTQRRRLWIHGR